MRFAAPFLLVCASSAAAQDLTPDDPPPPPVWEEILRLRARLDALERAEGAEAQSEPTSIDLSDEEVSALQHDRDHVLSRAWYENLRVSGYGALAYLDSGGTGTTKHGSFLVKEASLFLDATVWEHTRVLGELWLARYQYGSGLTLGELYLQRSRLLGDDAASDLGLVVGKFEIPFGEDYLRWDAPEAPLITFSAADPYGMDEGVELFGSLGDVHWIAALTNGNAGAADDGAAKLLALKAYGDAHRDVYLSGSVLYSGSTDRSALRLSGSSITAVGLDGPSTVGDSPSEEVDSLMWELDARLASTRVAGVNLQFGRAVVDDDEDAFDRDLTWFQVEPTVRLSEELDLVARWSEIGTYDDDEGYRFAGKITADAEAFGYDSSVLRRVSGGLRWTIHPRLIAKLEVGRDRIELIDASSLDTEDDERLYFGLEIVGSF